VCLRDMVEEIDAELRRKCNKKCWMRKGMMKEEVPSISLRLLYIRYEMNIGFQK